MRTLRELLALPFRLAPVDLLTALAVAAIAFSFMAAPVLGQASGSPAASILRTPAPESGGVSAAPSASVPLASAVASLAAASPVGSPATAASPAASPSAAASAVPPCPHPNPTPTPPAPGATPRHLPLCPAQPEASNPLSLLAWIFTPIFQVLFMGLALFYDIFGDIGTAIVVLTILMRLLLVPVFRAQIVSQRRMQMLQPELRAIQVKYKGNRTKISEEQMKLYKERGVNPASGCLPGLIQLVLLLPMYQVFTQGLSAPDISSMLQIFGQPVITVQCQDPGNPNVPCIDPAVWWLSWIPKIDSTGFHMPGYPGGLPANQPEVFWDVLPKLFGLSLMALVSAILQLIQTRMMATRTDDPQVRSQQRIFLLLPIFSLIYGTWLPAGLFIYWITTTTFSIVQQYLINGWGALFPIMGWTPGFAVDHQPRFPVQFAQPTTVTKVDATDATAARRSTTESAAGTIRPARGRTNRRGRRR